MGAGRAWVYFIFQKLECFGKMGGYEGEREGTAKSGMRKWTELTKRMGKGLIGWVIVILLLSACNSQSEPTKLESSHSDLSYGEATNQGYVVAGPAGLANVAKLEAFFDDYRSKRKNSVKIARYTDEGDPIYVDLDFDGEYIGYTYDNSWDGFGGQDKGVRKTSCKEMGQRIGPRGDKTGTEYYLSSCEDNIGYSDVEKKEYFILFVSSDSET